MLNTIGIFGLGEAGALFARDLVDAGLTVAAYDPADVPTPDGVQRFANPHGVVPGADFIFAVTAAEDAETAMRQAIDSIPPTAVYADFATAPASLKQRLATLAAERGFLFADVALLAIVPGNGIRATALVSGTGAEAFARAMAPLGMPVTALSDQAGEAATRKLLRSVMMKGLAAATIEALRAAEAAGCADWLWENLSGEITRADAATLARLVTGSEQHAARRLHEMEASASLLEELNVEPTMTRSTVESLRDILHHGIPKIPT